MFQIENQTKQFEEAMKKAFEFWVDIAIDTLKMYKPK